MALLRRNILLVAVLNGIRRTGQDIDARCHNDFPNTSFEHILSLSQGTKF